MNRYELLKCIMARNETVEPIYQTTRRHTPEDHDPIFIVCPWYVLSAMRTVCLVLCALTAERRHCFVRAAGGGNRNSGLRSKQDLHEITLWHNYLMAQFMAKHSSFCGINPLNPELNPICYLLALLGTHHFLHVSRIRVKLLTLRRLMSYIYGAPILDVSRSHTTTQHSR